jgi:hypothetical protein
MNCHWLLIHPQNDLDHADGIRARDSRQSTKYIGFGLKLLPLTLIKPNFLLLSSWYTIPMTEAQDNARRVPMLDYLVIPYPPQPN